MEIKTRLAGIVIILFGAFCVLFGGLILAGAIWALVTGEHVGSSDGYGALCS